MIRNAAALELASTAVLTKSWDEPWRSSRKRSRTSTARTRARAAPRVLACGHRRADPRLVAEFDARAAALQELARESACPARSLALLLGAVSAWRTGDEHEVLPLIERGFEDGRPLAAGVEPWAVGQGLGALILCDQSERARELAAMLLAEARALGSIAGFILGTAYLGFVDARHGRLATAEEALRAALAPAREARLNFVLFFQLWFATDVVLERPQADDLASFISALELGPLSELHVGAMLRDVRGRVRHARGETAAAVEDLRAAGAIFDALGLRNPNASNWRSALALMLGPEERSESQRLVQEELRAARRVGHGRAIGVALRALGVLESEAKGRKRLEESLAILGGSDARIEQARTLVELGAAMRRSGERAAAREPLRAGLDIAAAAGATRLGERARAELEASGGRPRRERASGRDALTPSELRVARLAAEGRTNNEVAQALFVTPKTVDTHLSHAYSKLGISSRRALSEALAGSREQ